MHLCHAIGCTRPVQPRLLMCPRHWRMVPMEIQQRVYQYYRPGQCDDKRPNREWRDAAWDAIKAVRNQEQGA